jgi:radical SAM superfamily enzyme YgiQ (UPF0313 family)
VDYFLEEIRQTQKEYPLDGIIFEDDIFVIDKQWLEQFATKYSKQIKLPYKCYVRPNLVTKETAKLLKMSGCHSVQVAIESGNEGIRNDLLKRNMSDKEILKCCRILHDEDLKVGTINILGLPTESIENMKETLRFNRLCRPTHVSANMFIPLPGVDLTSFAIQEGLLDENFISSKSTHHISELRYPEDVKRFLYPFKALFPLMVKMSFIEKMFPLLMKLPKLGLKIVDSAYRLYSNAKFHPPVNFNLRDKWRVVRRYLSLIS